MCWLDAHYGCSPDGSAFDVRRHNTSIAAPRQRLCVVALEHTSTIVAIPFGTAAIWASVASRWSLCKRGADAVEMPVPPASITDHQVITLVTEAKA